MLKGSARTGDALDGIHGVPGLSGPPNLYGVDCSARVSMQGVLSGAPMSRYGALS